MYYRNLSRNDYVENIKNLRLVLAAYLQVQPNDIRLVNDFGSERNSFSGTLSLRVCMVGAAGMETLFTLATDKSMQFITLDAATKDLLRQAAGMLAVKMGVSVVGDSYYNLVQTADAAL